jgi:hypothetical protein
VRGAQATRRRSLALAGGTLLSVALAACGKSDGHTGKQGSASGGGSEYTDDGALLLNAIDVERSTVLAYEHALPSLAGADRVLATRILAQERAHAAKLERELIGLGGKLDILPPKALPVLADSGAALRFLSHAEDTEIGFYIDMLAKLSSPFRALPASILPVEAEHLALLHRARGVTIAPTAFPVGSL